MKKVAIAAALLIATAATNALAQEPGPYFGLNAGVTIPHESTANFGTGSNFDVSYHTGYSVGASVGYYVNPVRVEFEYARRSAGTKETEVPSSSGRNSGGGIGFDRVNLAVSSFMLNGIYDFKTESIVSPFMGAGLGWMYGTFADVVSDPQFGYQAMAGLAFKMRHNMDFDLSYKFQGAASDLDFSSSSGREKLSYHSSNLLAGVRVRF